MFALQSPLQRNDICSKVLCALLNTLTTSAPSQPSPDIPTRSDSDADTEDMIPMTPSLSLNLPSSLSTSPFEIIASSLASTDYMMHVLPVSRSPQPETGKAFVGLSATIPMAPPPLAIPAVSNSVTLRSTTPAARDCAVSVHACSHLFDLARQCFVADVDNGFRNGSVGSWEALRLTALTLRVSLFSFCCL